jgi:hypothetical protein
MSQLNPHSIQLQISRMFESGQSLFALTKMQDWLKQRNEDPADYEITFLKQPALPGSGLVVAIKIQLQRKDGAEVDKWILDHLNDAT